MKRVLIAALALSMIAAIAGAQHHGGGGMGGGIKPGAPANGAGRGMDEGMQGGHNLVVAPDGTIFVTQNTKITAVRSTGAVAWTATLADAHGPLFLSGSNLLFVDRSVATDGTVSSVITALSTATGTTAWTRTLAGHVNSLEPLSGGTYAIVVTPGATASTGTLSLVAIGSDGSILWTLPLT